MDQLVAAQVRTEETLEKILAVQYEMAGGLSDLSAISMECRYRSHPASYFGQIARRLRLLSDPEIEDLIDQAIASGLATRDEADGLRLADLVFAGKSPEDGTDLYLVIEAPIGVGIHDVERAVERAKVLAKTGSRAVAVVAGRRVDPDARIVADDYGVWQVSNGKALPPRAASQ